MTREQADQAYLPGHHPFLKVGDRVRYVGSPRRFYSWQQKVHPGDMGTIVHDFGWDSRFLILLDREFWGGNTVHRYIGVEFTVRCGWSGWERVHDDPQRP